MKSIRTKTTLLTVLALVAALAIATFLGVMAVRNLGNSNSDQLLYLMCETGQKNLDLYFESVEQSVVMVSTFVDEDLDAIEELDDEELEAHMDRVKWIFEKTANKTNGVLTYYYRIDPSVSEKEKGFWFTNLDGEGFVPHEVTDITQYDTEDTSKLVWYTVPKATGEGVWLPPYITDNLDVRVISYNVPIYREGQFIGVVGIEIDYTTMAEQVDNIQLYENGYAFINDEEGRIIYHPYIDVTTMSDDERPKVPDGLLTGGTFVKYTFEGVEKQAVRLPLSNGMILNVSVPTSEISSSWRQLIFEMILVAAILLAVFILLTLRLTSHITKPLEELTDVAHQVNEGNYDIEMDYKGNDEIGVLTKAFTQLTGHLKVYISDLNSLAYADALTSVHNKGAFDIYIRDMQAEMDISEEKPEFAVAVFDCDNLKKINDRYGHEKGDQYLKNASALICRVFMHSPVFRTGGDEFSAVLMNEDYQKRSELAAVFEKECADSCASNEMAWEQVRISMGMVDYDPERDDTVDDVVRRADKQMYENKRERKIADYYKNKK